jgi:formylglycine-generating enzyme required for sulfatase activity
MATIPSEPLPPRLSQLGFQARRINGVDVIVPPVCNVPDGDFLTGSDPQVDGEAQADELPQHTVALHTFEIGRFPVTIAEFACFERYAATALSLPRLIPGHQAPRPDHPVVFVTWPVAVEYARWLAQMTGEPWRLPSEAQWEKAARWDAQLGEARIYPWGERFDASRCNTAYGGQGVGDTAPVGTYPSGASPCGAQDMVGNVQEWTTSHYEPYPYRSDDGREAVASGARRVLRGEFWNTSAFAPRAAFRNSYAPYPDRSTDAIGFRLVRER